MFKSQNKEIKSDCLKQISKITTFVAKYAQLSQDFDQISQPLDLPPQNNDILRQKELEFNKLDF